MKLALAAATSALLLSACAMDSGRTASFVEQPPLEGAGVATTQPQIEHPLKESMSEGMFTEPPGQPTSGFR